MEKRDEEIIKALRCCADKGCKFCAEQGKPYCKETIASLAWDLIQRQKAEIEWLQKANESFGEAGGKLVVAYKKVKTEAYKEFADRVKKKAEIVSCGDYGFVYEIGEDDIDNLLTEMEEQK